MCREDRIAARNPGVGQVPIIKEKKPINQKTNQQKPKAKSVRPWESSRQGTGTAGHWGRLGCPHTGTQPVIWGPPYHHHPTKRQNTKQLFVSSKDKTTTNKEKK